MRSTQLFLLINYKSNSNNFEINSFSSKQNIMKKLTVLCFIFLLSGTIYSQESTSIKFHSVSAGFGGFYFKKEISEGGGISYLTDVTLSKGKNLLSVAYLGGDEIGVVGSSNYSFSEISLSYGREFKVNNWFSLEGFAGLGFYNQTSGVADVADDNSISFPFKINSKFYFNKRFGMGINAHYSLNSVNNNFSSNLIFHYKFN